jgi:hypothetical protein
MSRRRGQSTPEQIEIMWRVASLGVITAAAFALRAGVR